MSDTINLRTQVQKRLAPENGGSGNGDAYAEGLIERCSNNGQGIIQIGTLVSLRKQTSGDISVVKTITLDDPEVFGPVIGTYTSYGSNSGLLEKWAAPSNDMGVAVLRFGRTNQLSVGSNGGVTFGDYIYAVGSNGQAYGDSRLKRGAIGTWLSNGSNGSRGALAEIGRPFDSSPYGQRVSANVIIDGGGAVPTTGQKATIFFDFAAIIDGWTALGNNASGSAVIEIWKDTYGNYPPNSADKITASAPISIPSNSSKAFSDVLTGWTTSIDERDALIFNLNTIETFTQITIDLKLRRLT